MSRPSIPLTVIIPVYNRHEKLKRAVKSVIAQDVRVHEIIVVDDGSDPPISLGFLSDQDVDVRLLRHDTNTGPAAARNTGLKYSKSKWISFLDSDDQLIPNTLGKRWHLANSTNSFSSNPFSIYGCSWHDVLENGTPIQIRRPRHSRSIDDFVGGCWFNPGSCVIFNRSAALNTAGYQDASLRRLEDYDWCLSLALAGFRFVTQPIVGAYIERQKNQSPATLSQSAAKMRSKWAQHNCMNTRRLAKLDGYLSLERAAAHFYSGNRLMAAFWLMRSFAKYPRWSLHGSPGWQVEPIDATLIGQQRALGRFTKATTNEHN